MTTKIRADIEAMEAVAAQLVAPVVLVLMGVSGSGKSTIALELQRVLHWPFQEGDDLHPPANVETQTGCLGSRPSRVGSTSVWRHMSPES
jgi:ABC-type phosphate/phosphonate transport system ATPase subunit